MPKAKSKKQTPLSTAPLGHEAEAWQMAGGRRGGEESDRLAIESKKGGEFYSRRCVVTMLIEMFDPYRGCVYHPCYSSSGMSLLIVKLFEALVGRVGESYA